MPTMSAVPLDHPPAAVGPAVTRVLRAYERLAEVDRPEVWITLRPQHEVMREAAEVDDRLAAGEVLTLAGTLLGVKDNIDVAGLPTTAGCPDYSYLPVISAVAVTRLVAAGAIVLGKTNLDQFATGLVGTRSPYGAVRNAALPNRISGGSSSGSAVAVALDLVDLGVGTDTAGSGRIPAAFQGIVGLKPTPGLVPLSGVVPAARSYDCLSVFAHTISRAEQAIALMAGPHAGDPLCVPWPVEAPLAAPLHPQVAVPAPGQLTGLSRSWLQAFDLVLERVSAAGSTVVEVDLTPFLEAAELLYGGALVAERYASVGAFLDRNPSSVEPTVRAIVSAAANLPAHQLAADRFRVDALRQQAMHTLGGADVLLLPTAPEHPTFAQVAADPRGVNARLGRYTNFANLFAMAAIAIPAGTVDDGPFGVTVFARRFSDHVAADVARSIADPGRAGPPVEASEGLPLLVIGAHLRGQPLHAQLRGLGARFQCPVRTAAQYRLYALDTEPPKPGMTHVGENPSGASIVGELYSIPAPALGVLLSSLPAPMTLGPVRLDDGTVVTGFLCHLTPTQRPVDITNFGGWSAYLQRYDRPAPFTSVPSPTNYAVPDDHETDLP